MDAARAKDSCGGKGLHDQPHGELFLSLLQDLAVRFIRLSIVIAGPCNCRAGVSRLPSDLGMPCFQILVRKIAQQTATRLPTAGRAGTGKTADQS